MSLPHTRIPQSFPHTLDRFGCLPVGMQPYNPTLPPTHTHTKQTPQQIWQARRILPLLQRRHLLLVTLLLFNSVAAEALPLALDELVPGYVAVSVRDVSLCVYVGMCVLCISVCVCALFAFSTNPSPSSPPPPHTHANKHMPGDNLGGGRPVLLPHPLPFHPPTHPHPHLHTRTYTHPSHHTFQTLKY